MISRAIENEIVSFYDTGLACWLLGIENEKQLITHPLRGHIFENMVISEVMKDELNRGNNPALFFYRDKSKREVDLLKMQGEQFIAYEIKSSKTLNDSFFNTLRYLKSIDKLRDKIISSVVIYDGEQSNNNCEYGYSNFRNLSVAY